MKKNTYEKNGITLIALVITIVLLLILAGISISSLTNTGLFNKAKEAKFKTEVSSIKDDYEMYKIKQEIENSKNINFGTLKNLLNIENDYNTKLIIENGELTYIKDEVTEVEIKWLEELGIYETKNVIPIFTVEQFKKISSNEEVQIEQLDGRRFIFGSDSYYILQNDLNLNGTEDNPWNTISSFNGTLNGQNFKISGLYVNSAEGSKGIFGTNYGTIEKLEIVDANISVKGSSGVICSVNEGEIKEVIADGVIKTNTTGTGASTLGGICGNNNGTISNSYNHVHINGAYQDFGGISGINYGIIEKCYNDGSIESGFGLGGIVGRNNGTVKLCINAGNIIVHGDYGSPYGGISGHNKGKILNCYNFGTIGTSGELGRYIGGISGTNNEGAEIINCYSISNIYGQLIGGIVGMNSSKIENCWYVKRGNYSIQHDCSTTEPVNSGEKTESEMQSEDFANLLNQGNEQEIWKQNAYINNGFPYLSWQLL